MSTKTSIKRIALVAVSALGFGVLSVVPATAGAGDYVISSATTTVSATAGTQMSASIRLEVTALGANAAANDNIVITPSAVTFPGAAAPTLTAAIASTAVAKPVVDTFYLRAASASALGASYAVSATGNTVKANNAGGNTGAVAAPGTTTATFFFTPKTTGTYTFLFAGTDTNYGSTTNFTLTVNVVGATTSAVAFGAKSRIDLADKALMTGAALYQSRLRFESGPSTQTASGLTTGAIFSSSSTGVIAGTAISGGTSYVFDANTAGLKEGNYVFRAFDDIDLSGTYNAGDSAGTLLTITLAKDAQGAASLVLQNSVVATDGTNAKTMTATLAATDSEGNASYWLSTETVTLEAFLSGSTTASADVTVAYSHSLGYATVTIAGASAVGEYTVKAKGPSGDYATTGTSKKFTVVRSSGYVTALSATKTANIVFDATSNGVGNATLANATITASKAATAISFTFTGANYSAGGAVNVPVIVAPAVGTSAAAITAPVLATVNPDGTGTFTVTNAAPTDGDSYTVKVPTNAAQNTYVGFTVTYTFAAPIFRTVNMSPAAAFTAKTGSTNTVSAILDDGYGVAQASKSVTVTVTGRNPSTSVATTDASGMVSLTLVDAGAVAVATSDTVKFTHAYIDADGYAASTVATFTITYTATGIVVSNVLVTAANTSRTIDTVEQFTGQPEATAKNVYTATVSDASGLPLPSGHVVTFSAGADDIFLNGVKTAVTDASGQATITIYRKKAGYASVTATIAGVSGSHNSTLWATTAYTGNGTAAAGNVFRNVAVTSSGDAVAGGVIRFTATVTDRWGNGVSAVPVTIAILGPGRLLSPDTATMNTNTSGVVQFNVTSNTGETGAATATFSVSGGQTLDLAGYISTPTNPSVSKLVSGVTAGNDKIAVTSNFTKDTSTSTADALLALAKAIGTGNEATAAADAALEAIDAANAATDAANLAAEAADAATVAAEEARDAADAATAAVEALASEVATLTAALKAQITALANTVAKIAKKVKA